MVKKMPMLPLPKTPGENQYWVDYYVLNSVLGWKDLKKKNEDDQKRPKPDQGFGKTLHPTVPAVIKETAPAVNKMSAKEVVKHTVHPIAPAVTKGVPAVSKEEPKEDDLITDEWIWIRK